MATTSTNGHQSDLVRLPESFGREPMKAGLVSDHIGLGGQVFSALESHYGSVKELAFALGNVDPSLARREIKDLDLRRFNKYADTDAKNVVSETMQLGWGVLRSPEDRADRLIAMARQTLDELAQYVAYRRSA